MKETAIIVDLDGTLCDTAHRQYFMNQPKKDWHGFYNALGKDKPHDWCEFLIEKLKGCVKVILVSGRPSEHEAATRDWLDRNQIHFDKLLMRRSGDFRKDMVVKEEIYREAIEPHYKVLFCIDDRKQVVYMWRRIGLVCLQCAPGDF